MANVNREVVEGMRSLSIKDGENVFDKICKQNETLSTTRLKEVFDIFDTDG